MQGALCVDPAALPLSQGREFLQPPLEVLRRTGEDKPEGYAAVLSIDRMMKPVRLIEAPQISLLGVKADIDAVVNEHVVGEEIHEAIGRDAEGDKKAQRGPPSWALQANKAMEIAAKNKPKASFSSQTLLRGS